MGLERRALLERFLHPAETTRPDDGGGELSAAECAMILPRLGAITNQWQKQADDHLLQQHTYETKQLTVVRGLCIKKDVELRFPRPQAACGRPSRTLGTTPKGRLKMRSPNGAISMEEKTPSSLKA